MEVRLQNKQGLKDGIYYVFSTTQSPFRKGDFGEVYLGYKVVEQAGKKSPVAIELVKGIYSNRVAYHHFLIDGYYHHSYCHDWRKRSMSTQSERFNPATFEPKIGVKTA